METKKLFISENENIFERFDAENIELDLQGRSNILSISRKTNNNYIGYYQFLSGADYYKIFILPKLFKDMDISESDIPKKFIGFLKQYYRLKIQYGNKVSTKPISGNIMDLSLDMELSESLNVEDFLYQKYIDALLTVHIFFQKHKSQEYTNKLYSSQSIRHKIDLNSNIKSLDKSVVHQIRKEPMSYSVLAAITLYVFKLFKRKKLGAIDIGTSLGEKIVLLMHSNENILKKRFMFDKNFSMTIRELTTRKTVKLFSKNQERKTLYNALLILAGIEYFGRGSDLGQIRKIDNTVSIFFNPSDLYEWFVYDKLQKEYHIVWKAGLDARSETDYSFYNNGVEKIKKISKPDFIAFNEENECTVIDAKWKVPAEFSQIHYEDVAKLKRDYIVGKCHKAILIYPSLPKNNGGSWYFEDDIDFKFELKQYQFELD